MSNNDFNNKNKYDFIIIKQRYKILNAFKEIVNFIQTNNIPLYSLSAMEIIFNKYINIITNITITIFVAFISEQV